MGDSGKYGYIRHIKFWIADCFNKKESGSLVNSTSKTIHIKWINKASCYAIIGEGIPEEREGAAEQG